MTLTVRQLVKLKHEILVYQSHARTLSCHKWSELFKRLFALIIKFSSNSWLLDRWFGPRSCFQERRRETLLTSFRSSGIYFLRGNTTSYTNHHNPVSQDTVREQKFQRKRNTGWFILSINIMRKCCLSMYLCSCSMTMYCFPLKYPVLAFLQLWLGSTWLRLGKDDVLVWYRKSDMKDETS